MVQPSSLVFVAITVGWAVYLLPRWVAHRDALGQDRRADRDSAQLRVLPRRDGSTPAVTRSAAGSQGRSKPGSQARSHGASSAPLLGGTPAGRSQSVTSPVVTTRRGPGLVRETVDRSVRRRAAARRARVLLSLAVVALTSWGIVALPGVPWWTALPATALLVLDVAALVVSARLRATARRRTAARVARTAVLAQRRVASGRRPAVADHGPLPGPRTDSADQAAIDVAAAEQAARGRRPEVAASAEQEDGTWTPVPVPRPTYLLKPVVNRRDPAPLVSDPDVVIAASASNRPERPGQPEAPTGATASTSPAAAAASSATASVPAAGPGSTPRPWEVEHTWADDLDLFLARRRAVNG